MHFQEKTLLCLRGVRQNRSAGIAAFRYLLPEQFPDCRIDGSQKHTCLYFQQIPCAFPAKTLRYVLHCYHYHLHNLVRIIDTAAYRGAHSIPEIAGLKRVLVAALRVKTENPRNIFWNSR